MLYIGVALHETLDIDRDLRVNGSGSKRTGDSSLEAVVMHQL
jgi:hypothetical protein